MSASRQLKFAQFDVKTAVLYGALQEEVFLEQPGGFGDDTKKVHSLHCSLCGLKQAPRCWNRRLLHLLGDEGLTKSEADSCLFRRVRGGESLYDVIYVDYGLVLGSDAEEIQKFLEQLKTTSKITMGTLESNLGMKIDLQSVGSISISQGPYTKRMLDQFVMPETNAAYTPATRDDVVDSWKASQEVTNREAVGSLMRLTNATRPDIAFAVGRAARSLDNNPTQEGRLVVKQMFRNRTRKGTFTCERHEWSAHPIQWQWRRSRGQKLCQRRGKGAGIGTGSLR